ncbi:hypothetical protein [Pseudomonas sp. B28(2017)]|uniref:hypothetical protein n=1 Tax=Pseudomonas sp. B28(2017) TaxID=1981730 RepID=UPI0015AC3467|nr:hypothetical protein [Pseudomonas sp. B28(2017)]
MRGAFHQAAKAHFRIAKLTLDYPKRMQSLTWDRGKEMADHKRFTVATDIKGYKDSFWPISACREGLHPTDSVEKVSSPKQPGH